MSPSLSAAGVAILFPLAALLVGWSLLRRVERLDAEERFAASFGLGIAVLAGAQLLAFTTGLPPWPVVLGVPLLVVAGGLMAGRGRARPAGSWMQPWPLALFLLAWLQLLLIEAVLPLFAGGNFFFDWWMHYDQALIFLGERDIHTVWSRAFTIASRNPLFNLAVATPMALTGAHFWAYQAAVAATNSAVVMGLYLVLRTLFGRRTAVIGLGLACLNIWLLHLAWFTWSKTLTAFYLLMALHFHLHALRRPATDRAGARFDFAAFWLASVLAFLTHQLAAPYILALLLHGAIRARREGRLGAWLGGPPRIAAYALASLVLLAPWYGWLLAHIGAERMLHASPVVAMSGKAVSMASLLRAMAVNALHSLVPSFIDLPGGPIQANDLYRWLTKVEFNQLLGALTATQGLFLLGLLVAWLRGRLPPRQDSPPSRAGLAALAWFGLLGALLSLPLHPRVDPYGLGAANLFPAMLALLAWSAGLIGRFAGPRMLALVLAAASGEYLILFWSHLAAIPWLDGIDANARLKAENGLVFLADLLGAWRPFAMAALLAVQLALVGFVALCALRAGVQPGVAGAETTRPGRAARLHPSAAE